MARKSTILGLASLERKLSRLPAALVTEVRTAMEALADDIVRMAKSLVPEKSGDLRDSIGWTWGAPPKGSLTLGKVARSVLGKQMTLTIYAGNDEAYYARWIEFGTAQHESGGMFAGADHPGTSAQPFFYPAYRASRKAAKSAIRKATRSAARKVAAGGGK